MENGSLGCRECEQAVARVTRQLEAVSKIAIAVGGMSKIEHVLEIIAKHTTSLMGAERSTIFVLDDDGIFLRSKVSQGVKEIVLKIGEGIAGYVAQTGSVLNIKDVYKDSQFYHHYDVITGFKTSSCLCEPIFNGEGQIIGVMQVLNKKGGYFSVDDEKLLSVVCSHAAVTITNHKMYLNMVRSRTDLEEAHEKLRERMAELDMLYGVEKEAASAGSLPNLLRSVTSKCLQLFKANVGIVSLIDQDRRVLYCAEYRKGEIAKYSEVSAVLSDSILSLVEGSGESYVHEGGGKPIVFYGYRVDSMLMYPLSHNDRVIGCIGVLNKRGYDKDVSRLVFGTEDLKLMTIISGHVAPVIAVHQNREQIEKERRLTAIGQMLSSVLHDLRTPLTTIGGYVDLMISQQDEEKRREYAKIVEKQFETIESMSREVLQYARGDRHLLMHKSSLVNIIDDSVGLMKSEVLRHDISLSVEHGYRGSLECDSSKIQRALLNLLRNAIEAIGKGGHVIVRSFEDGEYVVLEVEDDGPGVANELGGMLFEEFVSYGKSNGTGLGLSIVRQIVQAHGGEISWRSVEPHGVVFSIRLRR